MERYDEDIYDNPFFISLSSQYVNIYEEATSKRWTLCIPRYSSVVREIFSKEDVLDHIIYPEKEDSDIYTTWSGQKLKIGNGNICMIDSETTKTVSILFEEMFYNNNNESFRVLCINFMLNRKARAAVEEKPEKVTKRPATFDDCRDLLFDHPGGKKTEEMLVKLLESLKNSYVRLQGESFRSLIDAANAQFTKAMQTVLKDSTVRRTAQHSQADMENLKIAVEIYSIHALHRPLFQTLTACVASQDAEINKMTRNSAAIKLKDLGIRKEFTQNIMQAKKELVKINKYSTPIGRLGCLKRVVGILTKPVTSSNQQSNEDFLLTTDDFLPILILLIVKSEIPNWMANLMYMKYFHFSKSSEDDEFSFYLTTVEAALEHIRSGQLKEEAIKAYKIKMSENSDQLNRQQSGSTTVVETFFQYVQYGDESAVTSMLRKPLETQDEISTKLCHPLCSCSKCAKLISQNNTDINLVTAYTRDDRGYTALHIAALYGQAHLIDLLIKHGAVVNASDYLGYTPLHLACQKGYQNIILLLVHFSADCAETDGEGNTPLHLCVENGHEDCVKAIVFLDIVKTKIDVNAQNYRGDTPLHMAAKWGYENIVGVLLENDASPNIKNRKKQTPFSIAHSTKVQDMLKIAVMIPRLQMNPGRSQSIADYTMVDKKPPLAVEQGSPIAPATPEVASLDQVETKQLEKLYTYISDGDLPMIKFHLGWTDLDDDDEILDSPGSPRELCHPLCQCKKCQPLQKMSVTGRNGINVNTQNQGGYSPLHQAVLSGRLDFVQLFLRRGALINMQTKKNITPLHLACFLQQNEIAKFLVKNDARVNMKDGAGDTPLHICCAKANMDMLCFLIQYAAKINQTNVCGNTPLHVAVEFKRVKAVEWLLTQKPDVHIVNKNMLTALQLAKEPQIKEMLEEYERDHVVKYTPSKRTRKDTPMSMHDLFVGFEAKDLEHMNDLNSSIRNFDAKKSLRRTSILKDASGPNLNLLKQSHSIRLFDASILKQTMIIDKSDPLHIYKMSCAVTQIVSVPDHNEKLDSPNKQEVPDVLKLNDMDGELDKTVGIECDTLQENDSLLSCNDFIETFNEQKTNVNCDPIVDSASSEGKCLETDDGIENSFDNISTDKNTIRNLVDVRHSLPHHNESKVVGEISDLKAVRQEHNTETYVNDHNECLDHLTSHTRTKKSGTIVLSEEEFFDSD